MISSWKGALTTKDSSPWVLLILFLIKGALISQEENIQGGQQGHKVWNYNGKKNIDRALAFVRNFNVAFVEEDFTDKSKLWHVGMYLKGKASDWWLTKILEKKKAKTWTQFKSQIFKKFLPPNFEKDVRQEWD